MGSAPRFAWAQGAAGFIKRGMISFYCFDSRENGSGLCRGVQFLKPVDLLKVTSAMLTNAERRRDSDFRRPGCSAYFFDRPSGLDEALSGTASHGRGVCGTSGHRPAFLPGSCDRTFRWRPFCASAVWSQRPSRLCADEPEWFSGQPSPGSCDGFAKTQAVGPLGQLRAVDGIFGIRERSGGRDAVMPLPACPCH